MLLDTIILIDVLRRSHPAMGFIESCAAKPSISVVSVAELYAGARSRRDEHAIEELVSTISVLPVGVEIAKRAGQLVKHYQRSHRLDDFDALIAATAEHHGLPLATLNVKYFPMFKRLRAAY